MGFNIAVVDPTPNSPCGQVADIEIIAAYSDLEAIQKLAEVSYVITYEFENIDVKALQYLEEHAYLPQGSELLKITRNRFTEKNAIQSLGISVAPFQLVETENDFYNAIDMLSLPAVLKTTTGGYDGKGQVVVRTEADYSEAIALLNQHSCILEAWVPFEKEISIIVARNPRGEVTTFPIAENVHVNQILHTSTVPANITNEVETKAHQFAEKIANAFHLVGVLAIELFVTKDGEVFVNELAPRPHNTGHYSMNACETSQFGQHVRAISNWPLGSTNLLMPVVMVNVLGEHVEKVLNAIPFYKELHVHLYGKAECKTGRKMGHINIIEESTTSAMQIVEKLEIWKHNSMEVHS
jgi:5-(carboxyamino)imidazole ribonucleotide synthase